jgi:Domain of unknown function (DUF4326)
MPQRYQRSRWCALPPGTVSVTRRSDDNPGQWGNPYVVGRDGTLEECLALFTARYEHDAAYQAKLRRELVGKDLACWCPLPSEGDLDRCHAAIMLRWANAS